jgi:hypothetical protein
MHGFDHSQKNKVYSRKTTTIGLHTQIKERLINGNQQQQEPPPATNQKTKAIVCKNMN